MEHRQRDVEDKDSLCGGDTLVSRLGGLCDQSPWADCTGPKVAHDHSLEVAQEGKRLGAKNDTELGGGWNINQMVILLLGIMKRKTKLFKKDIWTPQFLILGFAFSRRKYLTP